MTRRSRMMWSRLLKRKRKHQGRQRKVRLKKRNRQKLKPRKKSRKNQEKTRPSLKRRKPQQKVKRRPMRRRKLNLRCSMTLMTRRSGMIARPNKRRRRTQRRQRNLSVPGMCLFSSNKPSPPSPRQAQKLPSSSTTKLLDTPAAWSDLTCPTLRACSVPSQTSCSFNHSHCTRRSRATTNSRVDASSPWLQHSWPATRAWRRHITKRWS
mmetsp:Transcript_23276/g.64928  ORF Transcript_23276/g.64928 Transcript_23276/m.64928 type:complete len:209 (+) Transcript_23276:213-839(+)